MEEKKKIRSNVVDMKNTNEVISLTLENLKNVLANSLGPYGSNTILQDNSGISHVITKDGYTIFNKIRYGNEISSTVLDIVKKISKSLVREVGDGSTSSIVIASELYTGLFNLLYNKEKERYNISPKLALKILNEFQNELEIEIKNNAVKITEDNFDKLKDVATISNNNDDELGQLIFNLFKEIGYDGFVTLENSKVSDKDSYEITNGYEIERGFIDDIFANDTNRTEFDSDNTVIFVCNDTLREDDLNYLSAMLGHIMQNALSLVIVAKDYDSEVYNFFKINKHNNKDKLQICAIDFPLANKFGYEKLNDFACYIGAKVYNKRDNELPERFSFVDLGHCKKVIIDDKSAKFIEGYGMQNNTIEFKERIELIDKELNDIALNESEVSTERVYQLNKRKSHMQAKIAKFFVGGNSEIEKENRKFLLEDSIYAGQSAYKNGYVIGGNLIIPLILNNPQYKNNLVRKVYKKFEHLNIDTKFLYDILYCIEHSFAISYRYVLYNAGYKDDECDSIINECMKKRMILNLVTNKYESFKDTTIINSSSTDIAIMKSAFSIIGLLVASNQFISYRYTDED